MKRSPQDQPNRCRSFRGATANQNQNADITQKRTGALPSHSATPHKPQGLSDHLAVVHREVIRRCLSHGVGNCESALRGKWEIGNTFCHVRATVDPKHAVSEGCPSGQHASSCRRAHSPPRARQPRIENVVSQRPLCSASITVPDSLEVHECNGSVSLRPSINVGRRCIPAIVGEVRPGKVRGIWCMRENTRE